MEQEMQSWLRQATDDLDAAEYNLKGDKFRLAAFMCQQAAEKALKAMQIQKLGRFDKIHDLLTLAGTVNAPDEVIDCCVKLNPFYTVTRYPDVGVTVSKLAAKELVSKSREVLEWAKKNLKQ